jgi:hypothetical protein
MRECVASQGLSKQAQLRIVGLVATGSRDAAKFSKKPLHSLSRGVRIDRSAAAVLYVAAGVELKLDQQL